MLNCLQSHGCRNISSMFGRACDASREKAARGCFEVRMRGKAGIGENAGESRMTTCGCSERPSSAMGSAIDKKGTIMSSESEVMSFDAESMHVDESERRGLWPLTVIWIGNAFNVSTLMTGAALGAALTLADSFLAAVIGFGIISAYMAFIAMESADVGLPTSAMSTAALGKSGGRYLISLVVGIALIGWFGVQAAVCGSSFSVAMLELTGMDIPVWIPSVVLGALMLVSAVYGFDGVKWVNYIALPLLFVICMYGLIVSIAGVGMDSVFNYVPVEGMGLVAGINISVGLFALGGATIGDFTRYAKSRRDSVISSVGGVWPANVVVMMMGAILAIVVPESGGDITLIMSGLGLAVIGMVALIASTWTVNVSNAYSAGLAFAVMVNKGERGYKISTIISGIVGIVLAAAGIMDYFTFFLTLLSAMIPALSGSMIADYWFIRKARPENFKPLDGVSVPGVVSFVVGALIAMITGGTFVGTPLAFLDFPFFLGPVNGIVVSMVLYVLIYKAMKLPAFDGKIMVVRK